MNFKIIYIYIYITLSIPKPILESGSLNLINLNF